MTPAIVATIITVLLTILVGLLTRYGLRGGGRDVGLAVFHEDRTEDDLEELYRLPAAERDGAE